MANTLEHKVLYTVHGETIERELKFASTKNAVNIAVPYVRDRLWTNVHFQQLADDGTWIEDKSSEAILMSKAGNAKKENSMAAVPSLIQLNELLGTLEKVAVKSLLTADQKQELVDYSLSAMVAVGISDGAVIAAVSKHYPSTLIPPTANNDATEKVVAVNPLPQIAATPRETPVQEKPVERLHVQVPDKEAKRGGLFNR